MNDNLIMEQDIHPLLKAKWSHFFDLMDATNDGHIEMKDFTEIAEKIFVVYEANSQKIGMRVLLKKSDRLFNRLMYEMHLMHKGYIEKQDWFDWLNKNTALGEESHAFRSITFQIFKELFNVCDQNNDGYLSRAELADLYHVLGIEEQDSVIAFQYIDENGDGKISRAEFLEGIREFFIGTDKTETVFGEVIA